MVEKKFEPSNSKQVMFREERNLLTGFFDVTKVFALDGLSSLEDAGGSLKGFYP